MTAKYIVLPFTAAISLTILALSLLFFYEAFALPADRLGSVKDAVLLPMFTTLVTAALTYIFGKPLVSAVADRIRASAKASTSEDAQ